MKRITTAILCASLLLMPVKTGQSQAAPALFMLTCALVGGAFVIYVYWRSGSYTGSEHALVLQESHYDGNWANVCTNYCTLIGHTNLLACFSKSYQFDEGAKYRVKDLGPPN